MQTVSLVNDIMTISRYSAALQALRENDGLVLCLQLQNCQIDDERASMLFLAMQHIETIASVDLSDNTITDNGFMVLTTILKEGLIPSLMVLDVRGNPISNEMHNILEEIQQDRKMLKIYHDSNTTKGGHLPESEEDVDTERAINLIRSRWSAACTDNGDNWLLAKPRICDQSTYTVKDKVQTFLEILKAERMHDTSKIAMMLKEILLLASHELDLEASGVITEGSQIKYSEGVNSIVENIQLFIALLDTKPTHAIIGDNGAGLHRVAVLEILYILVFYYLYVVEESLISSNIFNKFIELVHGFPQNSILHCVIFRILQAILSRPGTKAFSFLLNNCLFLSFLAQEGNHCSTTCQGKRPSYSGQIYALSKIVSDMGNADQNVKELLGKNEEWVLYTDGPFKNLQAEQEGELCGPKPVIPPSVKHFLQHPARDVLQISQFTV